MLDLIRDLIYDYGMTIIAAATPVVTGFIFYAKALKKAKKDMLIQLVNTITEAIKNHDIDVFNLVKDIKSDNKLLAEMFMLISSKQDLPFEDLIQILERFKTLTTTDNVRVMEIERELINKSYEEEKKKNDLKDLIIPTEREDIYRRKVRL